MFMQEIESDLQQGPRVEHDDDDIDDMLENTSTPSPTITHHVEHSIAVAHESSVTIPHSIECNDSQDDHESEEIVSSHENQTGDQSNHERRSPIESDSLELAAVDVDNDVFVRPGFEEIADSIHHEQVVAPELGHPLSECREGTNQQLNINDILSTSSEAV